MLQVKKIQAEFPEAFGFLFQPHRYKVAYGGRGGAKSWAFARALLIQAAERPLRVLCARELQKSIKDSVHKLLSDQVVSLELEHVYEVQQASIKGRPGTSAAGTEFWKWVLRPGSKNHWLDATVGCYALGGFYGVLRAEDADNRRGKAGTCDDEG